MVEFQNVSVTYASGVDALNNVSLKINDGDFAFVVGSSGAGKSTMIKLILKEIDATSGTVTVNGYNLNDLKKKQIPEFRRTLGFVFQDFRLISSMTVYDNIAFVLRVIDSPPKLVKKRVSYVINLVGLDDKINSYPDELSGGEKQRVAIARALVNDPQMIIADEPTGNIDPELSYEIVDLLKGINDRGTTVLMVTHEHDLVRRFGGRIINITDGEIVFDEVITGMDEIPDDEFFENGISAGQMSENEFLREEETFPPDSYDSDDYSYNNYNNYNNYDSDNYDGVFIPPEQQTEETTVSENGDENPLCLSEDTMLDEILAHIADEIEHGEKQAEDVPDTAGEEVGE